MIYSAGATSQAVASNGFTHGQRSEVKGEGHGARKMMRCSGCCVGCQHFGGHEVWRCQFTNLSGISRNTIYSLIGHAPR